MTLDEQIDFFFALPYPPHVSGPISPLRLVRQEAQSCLISGNIIDEDAIIDCPER